MALKKKEAEVADIRCPDCGGRGLKDADTLCASCEGSGISKKSK